MRELQTVGVLGLGTFGQALCRAFKRAEVDIIAVDHVEENVHAIRDTVDRAIIGDVTDPAVLDEAGLRSCECVVIAIGENTESNVIATLNIQDMGIERIYARAMSRTHRRILEKLGVTMMFNPEQDAAQRLAATIAHRGIERLAELDDGFSFVVVDVPDSFSGRSLQRLDVRRRYGINIVGIRRVEEGVSEAGLDVAYPRFILPDGGTVIEEGDRLLVIGRSEDIAKVVEGG